MAPVNVINWGSKNAVNICKHYSLLHLRRKLHVASTKEPQFYDIIIAGGGMVGTTLACKLAQNPKLSNKSILLLEGSPEQQWSLQPRYSNRVSALNNSTKSLLMSINAWKHISDARFKGVKKMQIWEAFSDSMITFNNDEMMENVAYILENDVLLAAVNKQLKECAENVTVVHRARIKEYQLAQKSATVSENGGRALLQLEDGTPYYCSMLIGADGANSQVRKAMGVQYLSWNYYQMGIVATVRLSEPTENVVAWQRFLPEGPIALLPLTDELSSLVWSTTTDQARILLKQSEESFVDDLNAALWKQYPHNSLVDSATRYLNSILESAFLDSNAVHQLQPSIANVEEGSRAAFPLGFGHATRYVGLGVALVGDAAHRVHPLAGQGVNLGFGDVQCLSDQLGKTVDEGKVLGSLENLLQYESLRQRHNVPTMLAIDGLQKLYGATATPLVMLRSLGLQLTHALPPIKKAIMNHAAV